MKNFLSTLFLTFSLLIYSNPIPIPISGAMVSNNTLAAPVASAATLTVTEGGSININLDPNIIVDRSLDAKKFNKKVGFIPPSWDDLIEDMYSQHLEVN